MEVGEVVVVVVEVVVLMDSGLDLLEVFDVAGYGDCAAVIESVDVLGDLEEALEQGVLEVVHRNDEPLRLLLPLLPNPYGHPPLLHPPPPPSIDIESMDQQIARKFNGSIEEVKAAEDQLKR